MDRRLKATAVAVLAVAAGMRFAALDRQSLWDDESFTLRRLGIIAEPMTLPEGAPPLYFFLLQAWTRVAGPSVSAVRAFSAVWGVAGVALAGLAARSMLGPRAGLFAAALVALHPFHLAYSQEARPYTLVFSLAIAALWTAFAKRPWWYAAVATTSLWTHPWGVFVWLATAPILRDWRALLPLAAAAPALRHFAQPELFETAWARRTDWTTLSNALTALAGGPFHVGGWRFSAGWPHVAGLAACAALWAAGVWREDERRSRRALLIALAALVVVPLIAGAVVPMAAAHQRYWMAALPAAVLLAARGGSQLPRKVLGAAAIALLAAYGWSAAHYFTGWEKGNIRRAASEARQLASPGAALIVPRYMQPLWKFYDRSGLPIVDEAGIDQMAASLRDRTEVVLVTLAVPNPVLEAMDRRYTVRLRRRYPADFHLGLVLTVYRLDAASPQG